MFDAPTLLELAVLTAIGGVLLLPVYLAARVQGRTWALRGGVILCVAIFLFAVFALEWRPAIAPDGSQILLSPSHGFQLRLVWVWQPILLAILFLGTLGIVWITPSKLEEPS